jgi:hypothetical protein
MKAMVPAMELGKRKAQVVDVMTVSSRWEGARSGGVEEIDSADQSSIGIRFSRRSNAADVAATPGVPSGGMMLGWRKWTSGIHCGRVPACKRLTVAGSLRPGVEQMIR